MILWLKGETSEREVAGSNPPVYGRRAVVVANLEEWSLLTSEGRSSNSVIVIFFK